MRTDSLQFNAHELNLRYDEEVMSVMRKHWFVLLQKVFVYVILFFLPILLLIALPAFGLPIEGAAFVIFFSMLWMLIFLMVIFTVWTIYYLDLWIVTNQRLIDIEQRALFNREITTLRMETILDVQVNIEGVIETILDFGTLQVMTSGRAGPDASIIGIPYPEKERDIIMRQVDIMNGTARPQLTLH